ncbi:MAG: acyltransferase family protein [Ruminococcus sp.]|nr:acyltransferase family protein [Ruminococcus sp.]
MLQKRNYGIDLLRIVSIFMVCILHIQEHGGVLTSCDVGSIKYAVFYYIHTAAYCAVDCFAIISGYTASIKQVRYSKIISMWFQVVFYSFVFTLILTSAGLSDDFSIKTMCKNLLPITISVYWYFTAYFGLFFIKPFLDSYIFKISKETSKKYFITIFFIFSVLNLVTEPFITNNGFSLIWLIVLYCLGALAKRINLFENKSTLILIILFIASTTISWVPCALSVTKGLINYISPTITLNALILTVLFSRIRTSSKVINFISPLTFGIYLFQLNPIIWDNVLNYRFHFIANENILLGIVFVFIFATALFISGGIIELIRSKLFKIIKIDKFSEKIETTIKKIMDRAAIILE